MGSSRPAFVRTYCVQSVTDLGAGELRVGDRDCDVGVWGDGTARNIRPRLGFVFENGISLSFIDTAVGEMSFEVQRSIAAPKEKGTSR